MWNLIRREKSEKSNGILGNLYYNGIYICGTLENLSKVIPEGVYTIDVCKSPAFTKKRKTETLLPLLYNSKVPSSRGIRIHAGNKVSDSAGCILVGETTEKYTIQNGSVKYETLVTGIMALNSGKDILVISSLEE